MEEAASNTAVETLSGTASASNGGETSTKKEQATELAMNLLVQGRRHLLVSDIPSAIAALAESSQLLVEQYGEFADECAESYYYYGVALLEMARTDSDVLGDAVEGGEKTEGDDSSESDDEENGNEEDEESEEEEEEDKENHVNGDAKEKQNGISDPEKTPASDAKSVTEANGTEKIEDVEMKENGTSSSSTNGENSTETKEDEDKTASDDKTEEKQPISKLKNEAKGKSLKVTNNSTENKTENGDAEETSDDVSNLQLAWEVFELAKNIYQRRCETDPSVKPKLADALIRLAEVAIESENYASAIEDLQKCLEIQNASFAPDSRSLAETHYQLGIAYTFTTEFKEAIRCFEAAANVIQLRIENLKNPAEKNPSMEEPKNFFHTIEGEIEELETLLPDIREKIADTIDMEKEALRKIAENGTNGAGTSTSNGDSEAGVSGSDSTTSKESPNAKPATDITHLIRKKRKPEEGTEDEPTVAKKICSEAAVADAVV